MDAILFSVDPKFTCVEKEAIRHLARHPKLYWEVRFRVDKKHLDQNNKNRFHFPLYGYMHIKGEQVKYRATIIGILPFLPSHYESKEAEQFKPKVWIREWEECKKVRELQWKYTLVINKITKLKVLAA